MKIRFDRVPAIARFAAAMGFAGLAVSLAMARMTPGLAEFLPPPAVFHGAAFAGATLAGALGWFAFGRTGVPGALLALVAALVVTLLGAEAGSLAAQLVGGATLLNSGPGLGVLSLIFSLSSPLPPLIWGVSMLLMHLYAVGMRGSLRDSGRAQAC